MSSSSSPTRYGELRCLPLRPASSAGVHNTPCTPPPDNVHDELRRLAQIEYEQGRMSYRGDPPATKEEAEAQRLKIYEAGIEEIRLSELKDAEMKARSERDIVLFGARPSSNSNTPRTDPRVEYGLECKDEERIDFNDDTKPHQAPQNTNPPQRMSEAAAAAAETGRPASLRPRSTPVYPGISSLLKRDEKHRERIKSSLRRNLMGIDDTEIEFRKAIGGKDPFDLNSYNSPCDHPEPCGMMNMSGGAGGDFYGFGVSSPGVLPPGVAQERRVRSQAEIDEQRRFLSGLFMEYEPRKDAAKKKEDQEVESNKNGAAEAAEKEKARIKANADETQRYLENQLRKECQDFEKLKARLCSEEWKRRNLMGMEEIREQPTPTYVNIHWSKTAGTPVKPAGSSPTGGGIISPDHKLQQRYQLRNPQSRWIIVNDFAEDGEEFVFVEKDS